MRTIFRVFFVFLFLSLLIIRPAPSYAYWHRHGYVDVNLGVWPDPYYHPYYYPYYADPYYADPYYYPDYGIVAASNYQPVVINGVTYYTNNGVYYIYTQYGYQAVAAPVGATANTNSPDSITVNIPNKNGGYTAVVIKKSGNGFIGPQGEFYSEFPKVSQLQTMYGK